jgi:hypothetical protein
VMRWVAAPLAALFLLGSSAFLDALEKTTEQSLALADSSEEAPRTTARAAGEVETLPVIARLTKEQAAAFRALSEALRVSANRIVDLNETVGTQSDGLQDLAGAMSRAKRSARCIRARLGVLLAASRATPAALDDVAAPLATITEHQEKSIRHLKSINRKLTALGVVATASDVKAPPPPEDAPAPQPGDTPEPLDC